MGLTEFYQSLEDKYYNLMDALETKGVKMYEWFINPLEDRGLPSMPFFALGVLLVLGIAAFAVVSLAGGFPGLGGGNTLSVAVKVSGPDGSALDGVVVKLSAGDAYASASKTRNGLANFDPVPYAKKMTVAISADGYAAFSQDFNVASGKSSTTFSVQLEKSASGSGAGTQSVVLFVSDDNQLPLSQAEVRFQDPVTGEFVTRQTDAQGKVSLQLAASSQPVSLSVSHDGYESNTLSCPVQSTTCQVVLTSAGNLATPVPSVPATSQSTVRVEIVDQSSGKGLTGKVTLFRNDNGQTLDSGLTDSEGVVRFDNVPLGVDAYAVFTPDDPSYSVTTSDPQSTIAATDFFIRISQGAKPTPGATDFSKVTVQAVDGKKNPVSGAQMRLYVSGSSLQPMSDLQFGDDTGTTTFDVDPSAHVFATVWAPGFLPDRTRVMVGGDIVPLVLKPLLVGNNGGLNVTVLDDSGTVVSGATVTLMTYDGYPVGIPGADTQLDGTTAFSGLPLGSFRAVAVLGAQSGSSDVFNIDLGSRSVTVVLKPATAFVSAKAFDATNRSAISATITATLSSSGQVLGTCSSNATACSIQVPASRKIILTANSSGYSGMSTNEITVDPSATKAQSFYLLPSSLSTQLLVTNAAVLDQDGRNVTVLDKGRLYTFQLQFNLPSNAQRAGAFVRVGMLPDAVNAPMVLGRYDQPSEATITKGQKFNPGPSCNDDLGDQTGAIQWVDWSYGQFGSKSVSAEVFVKPTATSKDQLVIQYRLYAKAGDAFIRKPADPVLGSAERTSDLDSCYAQTIAIPLKFVDGQSTCNDNACISTLFNTNSSSATNALRVDAGQAFNVSVDLRAFGALQSPFLTVKASPSVEFTGYDFGTTSTAQGPAIASGQTLTVPLSFFQRANGTIRMRALVPTQSANLVFSFSDTSGSILDASRFVVVQGTGQFKLTPSPLFIQALKSNALTVTVLSNQGIAVTDAKLALDETDGSPFSGFPNVPVFIQGNGLTGTGQGGQYVFKNLKPDSVGAFDVVATKDGFTEARATVGVNATEPLQFQQDISNLQLDCKNPTTLSVRSAVNAELKVSASFSGSGCANVKVLNGGVFSSTTTGADGGATGTVSFRVKPDKDTSLFLTPALDTVTPCVLTFNAQTLSGLALGDQPAFFSVACGLNGAGNGSGLSCTNTTAVTIAGSVATTCVTTACTNSTTGLLVSNTTSCGTSNVNATPVPGADCAAQGGVCAAAGQACPSGYVPSTFQPNNGVLTGQQSCQSMGGACIGSGQCPSGQVPLSGACFNGGFQGGLCCGTSAASPTPVPVCASGGQCCQSINKFCQAPVFNFQNIFSKYLGYYLGVQTLSTYPQQVTAASAPTQLVASQSGIGLKPGKLSPGCTQSAGGLECHKDIFALMPTNAMAFSVENQLFTQTTVLAKRQEAASCYAVQEVGSQSGLSSIYNGVVNDITSGAALPTRQVRTFTLTFKPSPDCVDYVPDKDGYFHLQLKKPAADGTTVIVSAASAIGSQQYKIHFTVNPVPHASDKYAFVSMPVNGAVTLRGIEKAAYEEPALFANNIPVKSFSVLLSGSVDSPSAGLPVAADKVEPAKLLLKPKTTPNLVARIGASGKTVPIGSLSVNYVPAPPGLDAYDVVGNVVSSPDTTDGLLCSRADYCSPDTVGNQKDTGVLFQIKSDLNQLAKDYVGSIDKLSYEDPLGLNGGDGAAYQRLYQQAMQDALREYSGLQSQYQACVAQGQDPLSQTRQACAQGGIAPVYGYPQGLPGAYGPQGFYNNNPLAYPGYGGQFSGGYGYPGQLGGVANPAYGQGFLPYQSNMYPGAGYFPAYGADPTLQQSFGSAFGTGYQQAGCNSDILNALRIQGQLTPGYFNPVQAQLMQQYGYSRGIYSNSKPIIADLQPTIAVPVKVAGAGNGIFVYTFKADLSSAGDSLSDYVTVGYMNSGNYGGIGSSGTTSSNTPPKGSTTPVQKSGFPYLKLNDKKDKYELQNWVTGPSVYPSYAPVTVIAASSKSTPPTTHSSKSTTDLCGNNHQDIAGNADFDCYGLSLGSSCYAKNKAVTAVCELYDSTRPRLTDGGYWCYCGKSIGN